MTLSTVSRGGCGRTAVPDRQAGRDYMFAALVVDVCRQCGPGIYRLTVDVGDAVSACVLFMVYMRVCARVAQVA
jgi:hypothetical protein